jgi:hypothetical protein
MNETDVKAPNRAQGLLGMLGGALIFASYFLPSYLTVNSGATPPYGSSDYKVVSIWNNVYPALFGGTHFDPQTNTYVTGQPHIFTILLTMAPIFMAALIFILSLWAFFKQPTPIRNAVFSTAAVVLALSLVSTLSTNVVANPYAFASNLDQAGPLLSLGSFVLLLGLFITLVSTFLAWQRRQFV